jgi:isoleucyl-tRNA synthetase
MDSPTSDQIKLDLKKTVLLPQTDFPMKAELPKNEPKRLAHWHATGLYQQLREQGKTRPRYVLHDGPPYANGNIHLGHAFNKILKDFIIKSKTMAGFDSPYIPGWDCHGLPIEIKVDGLLGSKKASMSQAEIRAECRKYAQKYVDLQSEDFQRLGILGRWEHPYLTMSAEYESVIAQAFVDFLDQGYVYKGLKPVNWCINDRTALAEAEVEYENHTSPSIWVRFPLTSDVAAIHPALFGKDVYGLIWTTTPWTIPANLAICYHPRFDYSAVEASDGGVYIIATDLVEQTAQQAGWPEYKTIAQFKGEVLENAVFRHPFLDRDSLGILGDHVTLEQGTGAVHTAPGHGHEDYVVGMKYGIPPYCPVDAAGKFYQVEGAPGVLPDAIIGQTVWKANPIVIEILREHGALIARLDIEHSYPHCWRCHKPTIFRATDQWFIGMEKNGLRQRTLEAIKQVKWWAPGGEERISNMIASRPDWCISRQRVWGVPIVVFYCEDCETPITDKAILSRVTAIFKEKTADAWYSMSAAELAGPDAKCPKCASNKLRKEKDILDVWFDSGSSHLAVVTPENDLQWPADMYLEGGDQYRGWFHSSLLIGVALKGSAPYREVVTNGWTLDEDGRAMSKSIGNTVEPEKVIQQSGADVLRLWVSSVVYYEDVRLGDNMLKRLAEAYFKLRNSFRYILGATGDFDPSKNALDPVQMLEIDQWILLRMEDLVTRCRASYDTYEFHKVYRAVYDFAISDLSNLYFDVIKDRLYTSPIDSRERRSAQTAVWRIGNALFRLMAPVLAFTADEAWSYFRKPEGAPESIHLALFPEAAEVTAGLPASIRESASKWDHLMSVRIEVLKSLEAARQAKVIGKPTDASVAVQAGAALYPLLKEYEAQLPELFIVSQVALSNHAAEGIAVHVERAAGVKCQRCWKFKPDVGSHSALPTICGSCAVTVETDYPNGTE